jgi:diguanylate cyclase (GGDEF)-like protein
MNPLRLARACAVGTLGVCLVYLAVWGLLWRLLVTHPLPPALYVMPLSVVGAALIAIGLIFAAARGDPRKARTVAAVVITLAAAVLLEYLLGLRGGLEQALFHEQATALLGGPTPGRPAPQAALIMLTLGLALWVLAGGRKHRFNFADLSVGLALFMSFTVLLGHLYQAEALYYSAGGTVGMSMVETLMMLMLAIGALCLNPDGVMASLSGPDATGAAKRRVLPVVVVTPVALGMVQFLLVTSQVLEFSLALALAVTANIIVLIALSEWVGRLLTRIDEERTGHFVAREARAKVEGMTDIMTGLVNRRGWDRAVAASEARCQREGLNACVIVIDLDGLKRINDTQGHAKGDEFIRRAATALRTAGRREDCLARLGGDEFSYLSIDCPPEHAQIVLKRLSQALQKAGVQASLGYAMRDLAGSIGAAFQEADEAMYAHKRARKAEPRKTVA